MCNVIENIKSCDIYEFLNELNKAYKLHYYYCSNNPSESAFEYEIVQDMFGKLDLTGRGYYHYTLEFATIVDAEYFYCNLPYYLSTSELKDFKIIYYLNETKIGIVINNLDRGGRTFCKQYLLDLVKKEKKTMFNSLTKSL